jgi:hypothetical protein
MTNTAYSPILVTGLPRSGTSMVAGLLHACGAWVGSTLAGDEQNPRGYFEHAFIREKVVKSILARLGHDPLGVRSIPALDLSLRVEALSELVGQIIRADGYGEGPWLYKDAKLSLIWPAFADAFPDAQWVLVQRDPEQVIQSCLRTPFMAQHSSDPAFWENFVDRYTKYLEALSETGRNVHTISSEDILNGSYGQLQHIMELCGLEFIKSEVDAFVCKDYWHS